MQGDTRHGQLGQRNKGDMETGAGKWIPPSPLFQNNILTTYSRTYFVLVLQTKKQETSEGKRGPSFLHDGPRRLGSLRVLAWPFKGEGGYSPFFALGGGTWEQGKVVLSWETTKRGSLRVAALKNCTWGSHTLSPTELGQPMLIVSYSFSNTPRSLNENVPSALRNSSENHPFPAWP